MFYFQQMFETAMNGIDTGPTMGTITNIANSILLLAALFAVYEAYARGGDARAMGIAAVKFLLLGLVVSNYSMIFRNVNGAFNQVAQAIAPNDVLSDWFDQVYNYFQGAGGANFFNLVVSSIVALISLLVQLVAVIAFPLTYAIFTLLYAFYGSVLYVCGPLVLALYPAFGVGQLARSYLVNLLIFQAWGIIYAVFNVLLTLINAQSMAAVFGAGSIGGWFQGASQALLVSLASILFSLLVALIPLLARRVVSGEIGSTMLAMVGAATMTLRSIRPPPPPPPSGGR
jgi:hypothetical protein